MEYSCKSIIIANYHNVLLFFPKENGGNDEIRVIFDVRNVTNGTFEYIPVIVDLTYDSFHNHAFCYLESAVMSYIMLLKWTGGAWCYQILFDFPSSQFSKYMYHSIIQMDNFLYWTNDRYIMSGRLQGFEKKRIMQPGWNQLYQMTLDRKNKIFYVGAYDYTENALFSCSLNLFSCSKLASTDFTINSLFFDNQKNKLYVSSIQGIVLLLEYYIGTNFNLKFEKKENICMNCRLKRIHSFQFVCNRMIAIN
jgi:hypothetical protein